MLAVHDISVTFGGVRALDEVELEAHAGEITGLIGPNGAGKSTIFNVITGLLPASGTVVFDGVDVSDTSPHRRARHGMARTFQRLEVFGSMTAYENILTAAETRQAWTPRAEARDHDPASVADELLERLGIGGFADQPVSSMPTGSARLVELGRALAIRPRLLLLDEPASGLDDSESDALAHLLVSVARAGTAILLVEHDMDLVMGACDRIFVLNLGRILASGTPEEIRGDQLVLDAYLGSP